LEVQELTRSYLMLTEDTTRVMGRLKAVFRGRAIACTGRKLFGPKHRGEYLAALGACALRRRAERLYQQLDAMQQLRRQARHDLIVECRKHAAAKWLQTVPFLGPLRAAMLIGRVQTPHRFRTKRQFWTYCGLAVESRDSAEYRVIDGQVERRKRPALVRNLNWNYNHELKMCSRAQPTRPPLVRGYFASFTLGCCRKECGRRWRV
jgi:transposase